MQLPKCSRCVQKGLACSYDLEPLKTVAPLYEEPPILTFNPSNCDSPGYCVFKTLEYRGPSIDPAVCRPGHGDAAELIRKCYQEVPGLIRAGKPAIFAHPKLKLHSASQNPVGALDVTRDSGMSHEAFKHLIQTDIQNIPIEDALTAVQMLLIYLATYLFSWGQAELANQEQYLKLLSDWTETLYESARVKKPKDQSPWQEWLFGESVRRTIVLSYALSMTFFSFNHGYCSNWLFLESLPFDRRVGLWMAESPQAWIAAAGAKTGEEVGETLSSYHEFAESFRGSKTDFCGDTYLYMLVYTHNGGEAIRN